MTTNKNHVHFTCHILYVKNHVCRFQNSPGSGGRCLFSSMLGSGEPFSKCLKVKKNFFGSPQPADILMKTPVAVSPEKNYYTERRSVPAGYRDADGSLAQAEVG